MSGIGAERGRKSILVRPRWPARLVSRQPNKSVTIRPEIPDGGRRPRLIKNSSVGAAASSEGRLPSRAAAEAEKLDTARPVRATSEGRRQMKWRPTLRSPSGLF